MANRPRSGAFWAPLMEKAAAKYFQAYERMSAGNPAEAYYMLTGMPSKHFYTWEYNNNELWNLLNGVKSMNWPMVIATKDYSVLGMPASHAYTILGAKKLSNG